MTEQGNLIPVYQEFLADMETPVSVYLKIKDTPFSYLLESADGGDRWGRYSIIGFDPRLTVISYENKMEIVNRSGKKKTISNVSNPLLVLREIGGRFRPVETGKTSPFYGGFVGYCNYDVIRKWERLPGASPEDPSLPEAIFTISGRLIIFDHLKHTVRLVAFAHIQDDTDLKNAYDRACRDIDATACLLRQPAHLKDEKQFSLSELHSNFSKEEFKKAVQKAREHIISGDVIQVVLSQSFSGQIHGDDFTLYRNLRSINPSPYMFYLNFGEIRLIGASPEILVRLTDNKIQLRPIAGTRPRGDNPEADQFLEKDLMADPKERAEHIMLVDLGRNDVGKVAVPGSVTVPRLMEVERYSHVMHIVSMVEGQLEPGLDGFELFMSAFPAGTVTGAPKIRAMEIISELEPCPRGPYAGAVGYFGFNGNMDFCITIRTISIVKNRLSIQVGAGIVYDSSPEKEYQETLKKGAAIFKAIERSKNDSDDR